MIEGSPFDANPAAPGGPGHTLAPGTRLQEFEIAGVVGEGGFGVVYEAHDSSLDRRVAIKEYLPARLVDRDAAGQVVPRSAEDAAAFHAGLRSFVNESKMLARFKHPALVEVLRYWEQNGTAYMAMPYYEGRTLKDVLLSDMQAVDEAWLLSILGPLTDAVAAMHAEDCFHLDIAPDNILILADGRPLLLDLGSARRVAADPTHALTVMLKPGYTPLEQYMDDPKFPQGPWSDVYALGAVVYFAVVGKPPPPAVSRLVTDPVAPLARQAPSGFSQRFLGAIDAAISVRPENRPKSVRELRDLLGIDGAEQAGTGVAAPPADAQVPLFGSVAESSSALDAPAPAPASRSSQVSVGTNVGRAGAAVEALKEVMAGSSGGRRSRTEPTRGRPAQAGEPTAAAAGAPASRSGRSAGTSSHEAPHAPSASKAADRPRSQLGSERQRSAEGAGPSSTAVATKRHGSNTAAIALVSGVAVLLVAVAAWLLLQPDASQNANTEPVAGDPARPPADASPAPSSESPDKATPSRLESVPPVAEPASTEQPVTPSSAASPIIAPVSPSSLVDALVPPPKKPSESSAGTASATGASAAASATVPAAAPAPAAAPSSGAAPASAAEPASPAKAAAGARPSGTGTAAKPTATVEILVRPWGEVIVDGRNRGASPPLKQLKLSPGKHRIELKNPAGPPVVRTFELRPGQSVTLKHDF